MPSHEEQKRLTCMADELFAVVASVKDYCVKKTRERHAV